MSGSLLAAEYVLPYWITYVLGWVGVSSFVWVSFERLDKVIDDDTRNRISSWLLGEPSELLLPDGVARPLNNSWRCTFIPVFDTVFGKLASFRGVTRSVIVSLCVFFVCLASVILLRLPIDSTLLEQISGGWFLLLIPLLLNCIPDYLSLLQSRCVLSVLERAHSVWKTCLVLALDLLLTTTIILFAFACMILIYLAINYPHYYTTSSWTEFWAAFSELMQLFLIIPLSVYVGGVNIDDGPMLLWACTFSAVLTTYVTSVWLWLYAAASGSVRLLAGGRIGLAWLVNLLDLKAKPIASLGFVLAYGILSTALIIGAVAWLVS